MHYDATQVPDLPCPPHKGPGSPLKSPNSNSSKECLKRVSYNLIVLIYSSLSYILPNQALSLKECLEKVSQTSLLPRRFCRPTLNFINENRSDGLFSLHFVFVLHSLNFFLLISTLPCPISSVYPENNGFSQTT